MKLRKYPRLSKKFNHIYKFYFEKGANPLLALKKVNFFLKKYPLYPEALVFKARMLIALSKHKMAMRYLKIAQMIDEWNLVYAFDMAELLSLMKKNNHAIDIVLNTIKKLIQEALFGTENYLLSLHCSSKKKAKLQNLINTYTSMLILKNDSLDGLNKIKRKIKKEMRLKK